MKQTALPAGYMFVHAVKPRPEFRCPTCRMPGNEVEIYGHKDNFLRPLSVRRYVVIVKPCGCLIDGEVTEP